MGQSDSAPFKGFPGFRPKIYEEADDPVRQSDREPFKGFLADDDGARRSCPRSKRVRLPKRSSRKPRRKSEGKRRYSEEYGGTRPGSRRVPASSPRSEGRLAKLQRKTPGRPSVLDDDLLHLDQQLAAHPGESARAWFLAAVEEGRWSKPTSLRQAKERYNAAFDEGVKRFGWEFRLK